MGPKAMIACPHNFAARLIAAFAICFLAFAATAQDTNNLSPAEIQGRQLAAQLLSETPVTNFTQTGVLRIRDSQGSTNIPITFKTEIPGGQLPGAWVVTYTATPANNPDAVEHLMICHQNGQPSAYFLDRGSLPPQQEEQLSQSPQLLLTGFHTLPRLSPSQIMAPFAGSDFWIADLGLEFFHWPDQKITGHETRRTRDCTVLESHNPNLDVGGYSRVVTWIDNQTLGIIHAEAYDADDKLLKVFDPKSLKKVNGQWELQDIEIQNVQTHSRTRIRFNLNGDS
jgi:hypothetical protein